MQWRLENEEQIGVPIQNHQYVGDCAACDTLQIIHLFPMWVEGGIWGGGMVEEMGKTLLQQRHCGWDAVLHWTWQTWSSISVLLRCAPNYVMGKRAARYYWHKTKSASPLMSWNLSSWSSHVTSQYCWQWLIMNIEHGHLVFENQTFVTPSLSNWICRRLPTVNYLSRGHEYLSVE